MKTKNMNMNEAQATSRMNLGKTKTTAVSKARHAVDSIKANPDYATKPGVQQVTTALAGATDALENNLKALAALRTEEKALLTSQIVLHAAFKRSVKSTLAVIDETAGGSAEGIKKWGLDVAGRQPAAPDTAPPEGLRARYTKALALVIQWKGIRRSKGYEIQIGDATGQAWGQPIHANTAEYLPIGLTPGQKVSFRVAVHRTTGTSDYSEPLIVTVR